MISPSTFHDLASGERRGVAAGVLRSLLAGAELPYAAAMALRNRRYDAAAATVCGVSAPVLSIGNLTVGGTGKTPMVEWIARLLNANGRNVAIVSRGYGAASGAKNDEALELELALPATPHVQNVDRVAAAEQAIAEHRADVLLLDDGFQHRRLARDFDVVLLDALAPFGFGRQLPRGALRESPHGLRRAGAVALSRADAVEPAQRDAVRSRAQQLAPDALWCEVVHHPAKLLAATGDAEPAEELSGRRVAAFCGIGNPRGFRKTLAALGADVIAWREFPDHHAYRPDDVADLIAWADSVDADLAVCTRKDLVKLNVPRLGSSPLRAVAVELRFLEGEAAFAAAILDAARQRNLEPARAGAQR